MVELGDRRIALARELGGALQLLVGIGERRLRGSELGLALVDRGFERLLLDREDHLVLFDLVAVLEQARTEETLHARPQIDFFERLGAPDKLGLFGHRPQLGRLDQDRRRRPALLRVRRKADQHREPQWRRRQQNASVSSNPPSRGQPADAANYSNLPSGSENTSVVPAKETGDGPDLNPA